MQSHCQHNLYICHCTPSSQDPSPIHPLTTTHQTTTLHRFPAKRNGSTNVNKLSLNGAAATLRRGTTAAPIASAVELTGNGDLSKHKYTVSHSSVAVMTSPTLNGANNGVLVMESNGKNGNKNKTTSDGLDSVSPSTASSCSSIPATTVIASQHSNGATDTLLRTGSMSHYGQHLGKNVNLIITV